MGVYVNYEVPGNLQEALALPGSSEDLIYKSFLKQILYHGSYGAIRARVSELLEETGTGTRKSFAGKKEITQTTKELDGKTVKIWVYDNGKEVKEDADISTETDAQFFLRVCAEAGVEASHFTELVQRATNETPFDVTRKERAFAEKKANKTHLKIATEIADNGALERVANQLGAELGRDIDVTGDRDDAINNLALAIGENERREAEARKNKYLAMSK